MDGAVVLGLARLVAALLNLILAAIVFLARPDRLQNRLIAAMMLFNFFIHTGIGLIPLVPEPRLAYMLFAPSLLSMILYVSTYLIFMGTLPTPLSRPFRTSLGIRVVILAGGLFAASLFLARHLWYGPVVPWPGDVLASGWDSVLETYVLKGTLELVIFLHFVYGLVVAIDAYRRTRIPPERRKMKWFVVAFGSHDLLLAGSFAMAFGCHAAAVDCGAANVFAFFVVISLAGILMAVFLAYGILATQLFDIDLRIKRGISRSTLLIIFIAVFVGVSAAAEEYLHDAYGLLAGGLAAALLVLGLAPLQRFADRVSDAAMPGVRETPEYLEARKREIYQAAWASAVHDGDVTSTERRVLATLADELGLSATEAWDLEGHRPPHAAERGP